GNEGVEARQMAGRRQLPLGHPGPELPREVVEHRLDRLPGDVRARQTFAEPLGAGLVAHADHDRVGAGPRAGAMVERLHEGDPERVEGGGHEPHRQYLRVNTFSRSAISTMVSASSSANS